MGMSNQISLLGDAATDVAPPVDYTPNFYSPVATSALMRQASDLRWVQNYVAPPGKPRAPLPRRECFFGDKRYEYSYFNDQVKLLAAEWPMWLKAIRDAIQGRTGYEFNCAIGNLYRDGNQGIGFHTDGKPELGQSPVIASFSLGSVRKFRLKHNRTKKTSEYFLEPGSLFIMGPGTQENYTHELCLDRRVGMPRINFTFRLITKEPKP